MIDQRNKRGIIGDNLDYHRERQADIAARLNISSKTIWTYEHGSIPSDRAKLLDVLKAYRFTERGKANAVVQALNLLPRWPMPDLLDSEWSQIRHIESAKSTSVAQPSIETAPQPFRVGAITLPLVRIIGGDGNIRYESPNGIQAIFHGTRLVLPQEIHRNYHYLLALRKEESAGAVFEQRNMIRLDDYEVKLSDPNDEPWPLILHVCLTDYYEMMVTNRSLETTLPESNLSLRSMYATDPTDFRTSKLANPLAVNLSLVTSKDSKIYIASRGSKVATNPSGFGPAISGTANPLFDMDNPRNYSAFLTAQRESYEEVTEPYKPRFSEITFFGLARTLTYYFPFLFGELRLDIDEAGLHSYLPQDNWDTRRLVSIPFTVDAVLGYIKRLYRRMREFDEPRLGTTIFSLFESLIYQFPNQRHDIIRSLSKLQS